MLAEEQGAPTDEEELERELNALLETSSGGYLSTTLYVYTSTGGTCMQSGLLSHYRLQLSNQRAERECRKVGRAGG